MKPTMYGILFRVGYGRICFCTEQVLFLSITFYSVVMQERDHQDGDEGRLDMLKNP